MIAKTRLKRWGNSFGVIIPKRVILEEDLKEGEEVEVSVSKLVNIKSLRGRYPVEDLQRAKDEMRKAWGE